MFIDELNQRLNSQVQVVTAGQVVAGILVEASTVSVTVRTSAYPGYNGAEDVIVRMDTIAYVRFFQ